MGNTEMVAELKQLRRGHGLRAHDAPDRIGPRLRRACGVVENDQSAETLRKVTLRVTELCGQLAEPLRRAALVALALHEDNERGEHRFLHNRVKELATSFNRDPRTALRRMDQAFSLLAELLNSDKPLDTADVAPDGWRTESLRSFLNLTCDPVELIEERRIVAMADELDEIIVSLSAPKDVSDEDCQDSIAASIIYGGEIVEERRQGRSHADFVVRLPHPLKLGQRHEYSVRLTTYPRKWVRPYYVLTPWHPCDMFFLKIRFDVTSLPVRIWRMSGIPPTVLDDCEPTGDLVQWNSLGEIEVEFHSLRQAVSYGVGWGSPSTDIATVEALESDHEYRGVRDG